MKINTARLGNSDKIAWELVENNGATVVGGIMGEDALKAKIRRLMQPFEIHGELAGEFPEIDPAIMVEVMAGS